MAVEKYGGEDSQAVHVGTGKSQAYVWAEVTNKDDNTCYVRVKGCVSSVGNYTMAEYGVHVQSGQNGSNEWTDTTDVFNYNEWVGNIDSTWEVSRGQYNKDITCWTKYWGETVNGHGACSVSGEVDVVVTIPARPYHAHGNPAVSASKTTTHYSEEITLSWAKSDTQGNANFVRFELYHDDENKPENKIYSGTSTSTKVIPSDYTGAKGGTVTFSIWELHEWYGENKWTHTDIAITVRSGVVTVYDSDKTKHVGLVTAYDSNGKRHYVLITAYDSSGKAHNVV